MTVAQFRRFVEATGHVTDAERAGDAAVMSAATGRWLLVAGAIQPGVDLTHVGRGGGATSGGRLAQGPLFLR